MAITVDSTNITFNDGTTQKYALARPYQSGATQSNSGIITTNWVKPAGILWVRIQAVGGGGSGQNPGSGGVAGTYYDSGFLQFPSAQETFTVTAGAAGSDPMSSWGGSGNGGNTTVVTSKGTYTAAGGAGSGGPGAQVASGWTSQAGLSGQYGTSGTGQNSANGSGTYGAFGGAVYITYYT